MDFVFDHPHVSSVKFDVDTRVFEVSVSETDRSWYGNQDCKYPGHTRSVIAWMRDHSSDIHSYVSKTYNVVVDDILLSVQTSKLPQFPVPATMWTSRVTGGL